jgi:RNA polymerase sigma-70 factor (ECF subfamily)
MTPNPRDNAVETALLRQAAAGDRSSWGELLARHRDRLVRMVAVRLDGRLRGRLDPSDVIQEAYLEASARLPEYVARSDLPFFLWLRLLAGQKLAFLHRHHLGVHMRDAGREVPLEPPTTSAGMAECLAGRDPRPSEVAVGAELQRRYEAAIDGLEPLDREILSLRHCEQLTNAEAARVLGLNESAASKRYVRALEKLREVMA